MPARKLTTGLVLGLFLGLIGALRIVLWYHFGWHDYGGHPYRMAATIWLSLTGVVAFGSTVGSMLPMIMHRLGLDPASASAPFVATLVDVTGLVIYFLDRHRDSARHGALSARPNGNESR